MNELFLSGRLTKDCEQETYGKGKDTKAFCRFSIACDRYIGNGENETEFYNLVTFGNDAVYLSEYGKKGAPIVIKGHLKIDKYEDKNGDNVQRVSIVCDKVHYLGKIEQVTKQNDNKYKKYGR